MDSLLSQHNKIVIVNLLDAEGKEAQLGDEYAKVVSYRPYYNSEYAKVVSSRLYHNSEYAKSVSYRLYHNSEYAKVVSYMVHQNTLKLQVITQFLVPYDTPIHQKCKTRFL